MEEDIEVIKIHTKTKSTVLPFEKFTFWFDIIEQNNVEQTQAIIASLNETETDLLLNGEFVSGNHHYYGRTIKPKPLLAKTPLAVAICSRSKGMVSLLISSGAKSTHLTDVGNIIHVLIRSNYMKNEEFPDMFDVITESVSHKELKTLLYQEDRDKFRPLELAAKLSVFGVFEKILNTEDIYRFSKWREGQSIFTMYDVTDYESFPKPNRCRSPVMLLCQTSRQSSQKTSILTLMNSPVIQEWMNYKYSSNLMFIILWGMFRILLVSAYIFSKDLSAYKDSVTKINTNRVPRCRDTYEFLTINEDNRILLCTTHILICSLLIFLDIVEYVLFVAREKTLIWSREKSPVVSTAFYRISQFLFLSSFIMVRVGEIAGVRLFIDCFSIMTSLLSLWPLLFFVQLMPFVGHFVIIIQRMLFHMLQFLFVFFVIFFIFSLTYYNMFSAYKSCDPNFATLPWSVYSSFQIMLNMLSVSTIEIYDHTAPAFLHVVYVMFVQILLLNFLIALMSNTVNDLSETKDVIARLIKLDVSRLVETRMMWLIGPYYNWYRNRHLYHIKGRIYIGCYVDKTPSKG